MVTTDGLAPVVADGVDVGEVETAVESELEPEPRDAPVSQTE